MKRKTYLVAACSLGWINAFSQTENNPIENNWFAQNWLWVIAVIVLVILIAIVTGTANSSKKVTSVTKTTIEDGVTVVEETKVEEE